MTMPRALDAMRRLIPNSSGQDLAEYAIALAVIGVGVAAAAFAIEADVSALWADAQARLAGAP